MKKQRMILTLFCAVSVSSIYSQSSTSGLFAAGHTGTNAFLHWAGWQNNTIPFNIEHRGNQDINFLTGAFPGTNRMVIKGTAAANPGFVGIGSNFTNPLFQLDVNDNTNLNINYSGNPGFGYRTNGNRILSNPGNGGLQGNIFVAPFAGAAWSAATPFTNCTFAGELT